MLLKSLSHPLENGKVEWCFLMKLDQALPPKSVLQDIDIHEAFLWLQTLIDGIQGIQRLHIQVQEKNINPQSPVTRPT